MSSEVVGLVLRKKNDEEDETISHLYYNHPIFRQCLNILDKYEDSPEAMLRIIVDLIAIIDEKQKIINSRYI